MNNKTGTKYLFIDTETGGTIPTKHSLLQIGLIVWDCNNGIIAQQDYYIKSKRYVVTKEAMSINKFDRHIHNNKAEEPKIVIEKMIAFLKEYFDENIYMPIIGHNIQFDVSFLQDFFKRNNKSFYQYFSHRLIDTYSVYKTLSLAGRIENINSSSEAFRYFGIKIENRHTAIDDCKATVALFEKLLQLLSLQ